jgi:hypothetical protein
MRGKKQMRKRLDWENIGIEKYYFREFSQTECMKFGESSVEVRAAWKKGNIKY